MNLYNRISSDPHNINAINYNTSTDLTHKCNLPHFKLKIKPLQNMFYKYVPKDMTFCTALKSVPNNVQPVSLWSHALGRLSCSPWSESNLDCQSTT